MNDRDRKTSMQFSGYELSLLIWVLRYRIDEMLIETEDDEDEAHALARLQDRLVDRQRRLKKRQKARLAEELSK